MMKTIPMDAVKEYQAPPTNLPEIVTQSESLERNKEFWRQQTPAGVSANVSKSGQGG
jgi:hypothetical protein